MSNTTIENVLSELRKPFHPSVIEWKPQATTKDSTKAMACAYADVRAYQDRLDEVCGMNWEVSYLPWGENRVVCHLTIFGVTRSSTGESDSQSERSEIGGTAAEAQALKRACSCFGLGRYLYNLPQVWVELDPATKKFTDKAKAKLDGVIVSHYQRHAAPVQAEAQAAPEETHFALADLRGLMDKAGQELYGEKWAEVCRHNVERMTDGKETDPAVLTAEQVQKLIKGMNGLKSKRTQVAPATA